jgi:REP element-mobilizing transposase RayT
MSHTNLNYHLIFSTKDRRPMIRPDLMPRLREYVGGIIRDLGGQMLAANGPADHFHIATILDQNVALSDVMRQIKGGSSQWMHRTIGQSDFAWQDGYAAFTISHSIVPTVVEYAMRQMAHHQKQTFQEEFVEFLKRHEVKYDARYIWT